jgi:hypothetical protein
MTASAPNGRPVDDARASVPADITCTAPSDWLRRVRGGGHSLFMGLGALVLIGTFSPIIAKYVPLLNTAILMLPCIVILVGVWKVTRRPRFEKIGTWSQRWGGRAGSAALLLLLVLIPLEEWLWPNAMLPPFSLLAGVTLVWGWPCYWLYICALLRHLGDLKTAHWLRALALTMFGFALMSTSAVVLYGAIQFFGLTRVWDGIANGLGIATIVAGVITLFLILIAAIYEAQLGEAITKILRARGET